MKHFTFKDVINSHRNPVSVKLHSNMFTVGTTFIPKLGVKVLRHNPHRMVLGMTSIENCGWLRTDNLVRVGPYQNHIQATGIINGVTQTVRILVSDVEKIIHHNPYPLLVVGDNFNDKKTRHEKSVDALKKILTFSTTVQNYRRNAKVYLKKNEIIVGDRSDLFDYLSTSSPLSEENGYKAIDYHSFCKFALTAGWGRATIHSPWNLIVNLRKLKKWMEKNAHRVLHSNKKSTQLNTLARR